MKTNDHLLTMQMLAFLKCTIHRTQLQIKCSHSEMPAQFWAGYCAISPCKSHPGWAWEYETKKSKHWLVLQILSDLEPVGCARASPIHLKKHQTQRICSQCPFPNSTESLTGSKTSPIQGEASVNVVLMFRQTMQWYTQKNELVTYIFIFINIWIKLAKY